MGSLDKERTYKDIKRVKRSRLEAGAHYDNISRYYDYIEGSFEKRIRLIGLDLLRIEEGEYILDIGSGTGQTLIEIADRVGAKGKAVGIDISPGMIMICKERLKKDDLLESVDLVRGDAISLPFKDNHFDRVFLSFTLELFDTPEIPIVLEDIKRILKDKGKIGVVSLAKEENIFVYIYEIFHDLFPKVIDCRPLYVESMLENEGFEIEEVREGRIGVLPIRVLRAKASR